MASKVCSNGSGLSSFRDMGVGVKVWMQEIGCRCNRTRRMMEDDDLLDATGGDDDDDGWDGATASCS
ncbi:hypothetical protein Tco_1507127 [Tanacetum coccineum]